MERYLILAEGKFGQFSSKTANALIRFKPKQVAAVIDSARAGESPVDIIGAGAGIPIVKDLASGLQYFPTELVIGIAPSGGLLPDEWRPVIKQAITSGLNITSGLHTYLSDDPDIMQLAKNTVL